MHSIVEVAAEVSSFNDYHLCLSSYSSKKKSYRKSPKKLTNIHRELIVTEVFPEEWILSLRSSAFKSKLSELCKHLSWNKFRTTLVFQAA